MKNDKKESAIPTATREEIVPDNLTLEGILAQLQRQHKVQIDMGLKARGAVELVRSLIAEGYEIRKLNATQETNE